MNNNPSVHDYFGLKAESMDSRKSPSEGEYAVTFLGEALAKMEPYESRIAQLSSEYADLDRQLTTLKNTKSKGFIQAFTMAFREKRLEAKMKKNRELNIIVHDQRLRAYQTDYSKFKADSSRIYGTKFDAP
jgi:hypothetical protein